MSSLIKSNMLVWIQTMEILKIFQAKTIINTAISNLLNLVQYWRNHLFQWCLFQHNNNLIRIQLFHHQVPLDHYLSKVILEMLSTDRPSYLPPILCWISTKRMHSLNLQYLNITKLEAAELTLVQIDLLTSAKIAFKWMGKLMEWIKAQQ